MSREFSDMDDKEFDEYLKRISEAPEIPFREEDWSLMKARIASPSTKTLPSKRWVGLASLAVLAILSLIYFGRERLLGTASEQQQEVSVPQVLKAEDDQLGIPNSFAGESWEDGEASSQSSSDVLKLSGATAPISKLDKQVSIGFSTRESAIGDGQNIYTWPEDKTGDVIGLNYRPDLLSLTPLKRDSIGLVSSRGVGEYQPKGGKPKQWFAGRFDLSFQAAPDLSGVKFDQLGRAGQAVGIGVEYFISPALSVNSGVFYFHKPYQTDGPFETGYGGLVNAVVGDCGVLDIPLNFRYYPLQGTVQRAFIGVGLSSYLMLSETYELTYEDPATGYEYTKTVEKKGENQHPFGVINLSVGYERKLAQRLSLQVEPYLKVPMNGVGEGNISLKSTGIFLGLKFYPGR
jgi:hypothetical protein